MIREQQSFQLTQSNYSAPPLRLVGIAGVVLLLYMSILLIVMHVPCDVISTWKITRASVATQQFFHFFAYAGFTLVLLSFATLVRAHYTSSKPNVYYSPLCAAAQD